jgi:hypothetical protein
VKVRLLLGAAVTLVCAVFAANVGANPFVGPPICSSAGTAVSGHFGNLTISGNAYVPENATLTVRGNLTIAPHACLDQFSVSTVRVRENVLVGEGATLALGCTPGSIGPVPPCNNTTTNDTIDGSILADRPLTMYLDGDTIHGDVRSHGGGPGLSDRVFLNFPIKDNTIGGNLVVEGWQGGWAGAIRNTVGGNLEWSHNMSSLDPDSNEVMTNTISGNLSCFANSPAAQVNPADGGQPNTVTGNKIGQCAGL